MLRGGGGAGGGGVYGRGKLGKLVGDSLRFWACTAVQGRALHGQLAVQTAARALADGFMVEFKRSSNASEFISLWV